MPFADHPWNRNIKISPDKKKRDLEKHNKGVAATVSTKELADYIQDNKDVDLSKLNGKKGK